MRRLQPLTSHLLAKAAHAAERHPILMAPVLATARTRTGLDDAGLATRLGCSVTALYGLALCRRPDLTAADGAAQVTALAAYIGCDATVLHSLLAAEAVALAGAMRHQQ
jgi:hypothetical protein